MEAGKAAQGGEQAAGVRHVLVTGGARGIGRAIASAFREQGMRVSILGRDRAALDAALAAGVADFAMSADVTDEAAMAEAIGAAGAAGGERSIASSPMPVRPRRRRSCVVMPRSFAP